jgi:hypothetical protein
MAVRDVLIGAILLFGVGVAFFITNFIGNTVLDKLQAQPQLNYSTQAVDTFQGTQDKVVNRMDYLYLGLFIGLALGIIVTGFLVADYPIFAIAYVLILIIGVVMSAILSNVWQTISPASVFGTTLSHLPILNHILSYLPLYTAVLGFIGIIMMFAKPHIAGEQ